MFGWFIKPSDYSYLRIIDHSDIFFSSLAIVWVPNIVWSCPLAVLKFKQKRFYPSINVKLNLRPQLIQLCFDISVLESCAINGKLLRSARNLIFRFLLAGI